MKSATDRSNSTLVGEAPFGLKPESIAAVKDFTTRKTLEQAHAFARGLADVLQEAPSEGATRPLTKELTSAGFSLADAEQIAAEGVALIAVMEERDRRADAFHAAVRHAGDSERALYDRLSSLARLLRTKLGPSSPALVSFGVPVAEGFEAVLARSRSARAAANENTTLE
jgi:hypothetical protein